MALFLCEYSRVRNGRAEGGDFQTLFDGASVEALREWIVQYGQARGAHAVTVHAYRPKSLQRGGGRQQSETRPAWSSILARENGFTTCPICDAPRLETLGTARRGSGYRRRCANGHEFDDPTFAYG